MPLAPGPIAYLERDPARLEPDAPSLEQWEFDNQADWLAWERELDRQAGELVPAQALDLVDPIERELAAAAAELDAIPADDVPDAPDDQGDGALEVVDSIIAAYAEIPGEAFQPLPELPVPPEFPPGFIPEGDEYEPGRRLPPGEAPPGVVLRNLTRPGASVFRVGDEWEVILSGALPGAEVCVEAAQNNNPSETWCWVGADEQGYWRLRDVMGAVHVGWWVEIWSAGGLIASPTLEFMVEP